MRNLKSYFLFVFLVLFTTLLIKTPLAVAENPYIKNSYVEDKAISLAEKVFNVNNEILHSSVTSQRYYNEYDIIDAILQNRQELVRVRLNSSKLQNDESRKYFQSYVNLLDESIKDVIETMDYDYIKSGLDNKDWRLQHLSSLLLTIIHTQAVDEVESLNYAEKSLSVIPTELSYSYPTERYYAYWVLYISFVIDGDLQRTFSNIEDLLIYARLSNRQPNQFDLVNNMAVVLDRNGDLDTAIKLTKVLTEKVDSTDTENIFVANLSHGRFLLKANRYSEALEYLEKALSVTEQDYYKAYIHSDLATAYAKLGQYENAQQSISYIEEQSENLGNAKKYTDLHIGQSKALILASEGDYEKAFHLIRGYTDRQIEYFKSGLSADRREANRRVLLTQEIAKKDLETAEVQLRLDQEKLARQKVLGRFYLTLIGIALISIGIGIIVLRRLSFLNKKLKRANAEVKEKSKIKTDLLAMFSHEMLTPLNGIIPLADILQRTETDLKKKKLLKMIELSGTELTRKMKDIILVANPQDQSANPVLVSVKPFLHENLVQFHPQTPDDVKLTVQVGKNVPEALSFDVDRVRAIIAALLSNSLKHTQQGAVTLSLYENAEGQTIIDVTDTGEGIPAERLEDMTKPFGQSSLSIKRENQGLGLGLTIVRLQCQIIKAEFSMNSQDGVGTSVRITLPSALQSSDSMPEVDKAA